MGAALDYSRVADLYDVYVRSDFDLPFFLEETRGLSGEVLELMAGTGRVSLPLADAGVKLTCVDRSPDMLAILRRKLAASGLAAEVIEQDVCALDLGRRFERVLIPFHSFSEVLDPADQRRALACIGDHLAPDGRLIVTLRNGRRNQLLADGGVQLIANCPMPDGGTVLVWWHGNREPGGHLARGIELFEEYNAQGLMVAKRMVELCFHRFERDEFAALAAETGYRVVEVYGDYHRGEYCEDASPFMIWVLAQP